MLGFALKVYEKMRISIDFYVEQEEKTYLLDDSFLQMNETL